MASPRSSTLFHFTKSIQTIQSILKSGFIPFYNLEDIGWLGAKKAKFFAFPMVCFCDIPISRTQDHVGFYGSYGIGMSKEWALKNGINPVAYYSESAPLSQTFLAAIRGSIDVRKKDPDNDIRGYMMDFLSYAKPISGTMLVGGEPLDKDFYTENEWRYVPDNKVIPHPVLQDYYEEEENRTRINDRAEEASITFTPSDVRYIFVKRDADIPPLINFINEELQHHPAVDLKILTSRVTSLEHLEKDI